MPVFVKVLLIILAVLAGLFIIYVVVGSIYFFNFATNNRKAKKKKDNDSGGSKVADTLIKMFPSLLDTPDFILERRNEFAAMPYEQMEIKSYDGITLRAKYYACENSEKTVICMHGFKSAGYIDYGPVVPFWHGIGYNVLLPDQRSCGMSDGKYVTFGAKEQIDCKDWAEFVSLKLCPGGKIVLLGTSMGGATVMLASSLPGLPENVIGVISDCGYSSASEIVKHIARSKFHIIPFPLYQVTDLLNRIIAKYSFEDAAPVKSLKRTNLPFLFIHGEADDFVPFYMEKICFDACASEKKKCVSFPRASHAHSLYTDPKKYEAEVKEFLLSCEAE